MSKPGDDVRERLQLDAQQLSEITLAEIEQHAHTDDPRLTEGTRMTTIWEAAQALREAAVIRVSILRAFQPGDVIILETQRALTLEQVARTRERLRERLREFIDDTGVKIILLDPGMHVVTREEQAIGGER